jgi:hypothetical protein
MTCHWVLGVSTGSSTCRHRIYLSEGSNRADSCVFQRRFRLVVGAIKVVKGVLVLYFLSLHGMSKCSTSIYQSLNAYYYKSIS